MSETPRASDRSFLAQIRIESGPGSPWEVPGRFIVSDQALTVRPWPRRWIPERSATKDAVDGILVNQALHITLPIITWHRRDTVRFENPECPLSGLLLELRRRVHIVDVLRDYGYSVTDKRLY
jgi:hypothetical protein